MSSARALAPARRRMNPVAWVGHTVIESIGYSGGVTILLLGVAGNLFWTGQRRREEDAPGFIKSLLHQLFWMLFMGIPLVGLVHIAVGLFLAHAQGIGIVEAERFTHAHAERTQSAAQGRLGVRLAGKHFLSQRSRVFDVAVDLACQKRLPRDLGSA